MGSVNVLAVQQLPHVAIAGKKPGTVCIPEPDDHFFKQYKHIHVYIVWKYLNVLSVQLAKKYGNIVGKRLVYKPTATKKAVCKINLQNNDATI
ncbi:hypothetical protein C7N43_14105 [Sphingobacteriales bacterium UPWRP_1]|nr:hypothetical protein BVG80_11210 [Sphingobacteriales bacterium TSM_CSM]PSJ76352.1 hypothetical protein C7N43_14105 [Sphingobacteriales bacterium UPWRP_1]